MGEITAVTDVAVVVVVVAVAVVEMAVDLRSRPCSDFNSIWFNRISIKFNQTEFQVFTLIFKGFFKDFYRLFRDFNSIWFNLISIQWNHAEFQVFTLIFGEFLGDFSRICEWFLEIV